MGTVVYLPLLLLDVLYVGLHPVDFGTSFKSVKITLDSSALSAKKTMPILSTLPPTPKKGGKTGWKNKLPDLPPKLVVKI